MPEDPDTTRSPATTELSDAELARRIAATGDGGSPAEEAELFRRYGNRLLYFCRRRLGSDDDARDLAQDTLLLTLKKLRDGQVRQPERIGAFILGVARNLSGARLSRRSRLRSMEELPEEPAAPEIPPPDPIARARVVTCVEALSDKQRAVVLLTFYTGHTSAEIARSLGLSNGNVRVLRHRGVARLRDCLDLEEEREVIA